MSKVDPNKITPEQKKFIDSQLGGASSVSTQQDISGLPPGGPQESAIAINQDAIDSLSPEAEQRLNIEQSTGGFQRGPADSSDPNLRPPTRAQDTYTLRQSPAALMTGVPRLKFEYIAAFRFSGTDLFETIFSDEIAESYDNMLAETWSGNIPPTERGLSYEEKQRRLNVTGATQRNKQQTLDAIRRSLMFNVKSIDGPKVNFQYDTLNQYNRKRNVYRRVDYDPINVIFHDTMSNSALKFWRYLYELNLKDGRNRSPSYSENSSGKQTNRSPYQPNSLTDTDDFLANHNFGLESSIINHTYPIKSLDLLVVHAKKYNLIRFIHPKVIAMQHDLFSYESSQPIEIGMQFAYETVVYETLNQPFDESGDLSIDLNQVFETEEMPDTPTTVQVADEGKSGTQQPNYDWTRLSASSVGTDQTASTVGTGSNVMNAQSFDQQINSAGAAFRGSILGGTPVSDAINAASSKVYGTTKSAVSSFLGGGKSGGSGNSNFIGGLGDKFKSMGPGDGRYNPDSKNYKKPVGKGFVKDSKGRLVKDTNGNPVRGGNVYDPRDLNPGRSY